MTDIILDNADGHPAARDFYYVTAIDAGKVYPLAGPYQSRRDAEAKVAEVRRIAVDPARNTQYARAHFMAYGVTKMVARLPRRSALGAI
jgi:N-acetylglutamate synthase-like GNAT family acetyltransferase